MWTTRRNWSFWGQHIWFKALKLTFQTLTARPHGGVRWSFSASAHSLWMGWHHALPNCIGVPTLRFARFKSWAMFNFWSFGRSVSQSNHMPVQALANQTACLCVRGGRFMWLVVGRVSDTSTGKLQRTPPCGRCVTEQPQHIPGFTSSFHFHRTFPEGLAALHWLEWAQQKTAVLWFTHNEEDAFIWIIIWNDGLWGAPPAWQ